MALAVIRKFLKLESASGIVLFIAAVFALIWANSPIADLYQALFNTPVLIEMGDFQSNLPFSFWINEGLMAAFFLVIGLELKREFFSGKLGDFSEALLPGVAALGGMLAPALIYVSINFNQPETLKGWAIPVATDIAFALGVLTLLGKRVPIQLKLFLMALAIFDDVGAIIIIALFYTSHLSCLALFFASLVVIGLQVLNRLKIKHLAIYLLFGMVLWGCLLKSGVHATIAGVILAFMIPDASARKLETALHPWVAFLVMPIFALANAGVSFAGLGIHTVMDYLPLGIMLGLFFGKQLGVFSFTWAAVRLGWAKLPKNVSWRELYGVALLCGIGFTMSLFLGTLAFEHDDAIYLTQVRLGVLLGSALSGIVGAWFLSCALKIRGKRLEAS